MPTSTSSVREGLGGGYELQIGDHPMRGNQGNDLLFLIDLRHRYASIKDIINNTLLPVNVMRLSTDYSEGKSEQE